MKKILLIYLLLFSLHSFPQKILSLDDCISIALENNFENENSEIDRQIAETNLEQIKLSRFPEVSTFYNHGANFGRTVDPTTNDFNTTRFQSGSLYLSSSAIIYNGNRIDKTIEKYELDKKFSDSQIKSRNYDLTISIIYAYAIAVQSQKVIAISNKTHTQVRELQSNTDRLFLEGVAKKSDQLLLEVQAKTIEQNILKAKNAYQNAIIELLILMRLPYDEWFDVKYTNNTESNFLPISKGEANRIIEQAIKAHPEIKSFEIQKQIVDQDKELIKVNRLPQISLFGNIGTNYSSLSQRIIDGSVSQFLAPTSFETQGGESVFQSTTVFDYENTPLLNQLNNNFSQAVGLSFQLPIFNHGEVNKNIKLLDLENDKINILSQSKAIETRTLLMRIINDYNQKLSSVEVLQNKLKAQENLFEQQMREFNVGSLQLRDIIESQNNIIDNEQNISSLYSNIFYLRKQIDFFIQE